ncbi:hypothetical protein WJX84_010946 [Apatococcus fuscideae]|uniref:protein-tyrosine-phosphatase n=1 Tax=Apatococcus fuscideae TaxID=2026836 RepID=A0AAW1SRZ1_9CHLO
MKQASTERSDPYARVFGSRYSKGCMPQSSLSKPVAAQSSPPDLVLVWDLDETLVTFHSLINGSFAAGAPLQVQEATLELGKRWEHAALDLLDTHFFYDELDGHNVEHIDDAGISRTGEGPNPIRQDGRAGSVAATWASVQQRYQQGIATLARQGQMELWVHLYNDTDTLTRGWLRHAAQLLQDCTAAASAAPEAAATSAGAELPASRRVANILVSAGQLVATLAKLLLFRLDRFFPIQNIYSSAVHGKQECFSRIRQQFQHSAKFYAIGDSDEELWAAESQGWPFVQINTSESSWRSLQAQAISDPRQAASCVFQHPLAHLTSAILLSEYQL